MSPRRLMSFKLDFRKLMDRERAWLLEAKVNVALRNSGRPIRNGIYRRMKDGEPVSARYVGNFLAYICDPKGCFDTDAKDKKKVQNCINSFLVQNGIPDPGGLEPAQLVEHLCTVPESLLSPNATSHDFDWRDLGMEGFLKMFGTKRRIYTHVQACRDDSIIRQAVMWFFADAGNLGAKPPRQTAEAATAVEDRFHMSTAEYQAFAIGCHRRNPWTVILARGEEKPTGVSIVLPLRKPIYDEIRSGKLMSCHADPNALATPSRYLLIEAQSTRPASMGGEATSRATLGLRWCITAQMAALSRFGWSTKGESPLYLLGVDGTPEAGKRLMAHGFKPTGTRMCVSGENLYERIFEPETLSYDALLAMAMGAIAHDIGDSPPP